MPIQNDLDGWVAKVPIRVEILDEVRLNNNIV